MTRGARRVGPARSEADPDARRALLERVAIATGERWADGWRESLRRQGRRASGGWPGTVTEARALVAAHFTAERHGPALTYDELECAARISYASARHRWLMGEVAEP